MGRKSRAKAARREARVRAGQRVTMSPVRPDLVRQDGFHQLRTLVDHQVAVQLAVENEVRNLIDRGHSWTEIGRVFGMTRQGARQRFQRLAAPDGRSSGVSP